MFNVSEITGDALKSDAQVICHQVNCLGVMGAGIALQIRYQFPTVFKKYKCFCNRHESEELLGQAQFCKIGEEKYICNLFGQMNCDANKRQTDYNALNSAVIEMLEKLKSNNFIPKKIAIPKYIGCGLAGGDWTIVKEIFTSRIEEFCKENNFSITLEIVEFSND